MSICFAFDESDLIFAHFWALVTARNTVYIATHRILIWTGNFRDSDDVTFETKYSSITTHKWRSCGDINITEDGVRRLLLNLNPNKACSPDGITPRLLKMVAEELTPALTLLYRISYLSGTLPKDWKQANITPVFKKGEKYNAANYPPIFLTCAACKLMEHIITSHIMSHLEKNEILCPEQHGFRRRHSCETHLLGYVDEATREIEKGNKEDTIVLDFSKAFDKATPYLSTSCNATASEDVPTPGWRTSSRTDNRL